MQGEKILRKVQIVCQTTLCFPCNDVSAWMSIVVVSERRLVPEGRPVLLMRGGIPRKALTAQWLSTVRQFHHCMENAGWSSVDLYLSQCLCFYSSRVMYRLQHAYARTHSHTPVAVVISNHSSQFMNRLTVIA